MNCRFLICGCVYGAGNLGDEAILRGVIRIIRRHIPGCEIRAVSVNPEYTEGILGIRAYGLRSTEVLRGFRWASHILLGGATLAEDTDGLGYPIGHVCNCIRMARVHGKPVCFVGIGAGNLSEHGRELIRNYYCDAQLITVRNIESRDILLDAGLSPETIHVTADPVYFLLDRLLLGEQALSGVRRDSQSTNSDQAIIGVNMVNETCPKRYGTIYRRIVGESLSRFWDRKDLPNPEYDAIAKVQIEFFGSEVRDGESFDYAANIETAGHLSSDVPFRVLQGALIDPIVFAHRLRRFQVIVTMRMHVTMLAAMMHIPVIPICRSDKMVFAVRELGLRNYLHLSTINPAIMTSLLESAIEDPQAFLAPEGNLRELKKRASNIGALVAKWTREPVQRTPFWSAQACLRLARRLLLLAHYYLPTPEVAQRLRHSAKAVRHNIPRPIRSAVRRGLSLLTSPRAVLLFGEPSFRLMDMRPKGKEIDLSYVKRVLVVRLGGIGDVVMSIPFLRELRQNLPDAWITLMVKPAVHNLMELCPYVNEVLTYDWNVPGSSWRWMQHMFKPLSRRGCILRPAWKCLWRRQFDLAIVPRWSTDYYRAGFIAYLSGAFWRIGYSENVTDEKRQKNPGFDRWYTHVLTDNNLKNEVEHGLDVIRSLGGRVQDERLELWLGKEDEDFANQIMESYESSLHKHLVAFCPGAGAPKRMWPLANFIELADWLIREYYAHILVVGGQGEESLGQEIQQQLGDKVINMVGRATVRQTGALLKHCQLYVGNDTGPMHLAAAAGTPVVEISCHPRTGSLVHDNSPRRFGPWGVPHCVLQPEKAISPCSNECIVFEAAHCILNVRIQQVKRAVEELLHVDYLVG